MPANSEIVNPNKDIEIPEWINENYFKDVLKKDEPELKKVLKFTPTAAIPPGENFTSIMLRIHMDLELKDGTQKRKSYVLKTELAKERGGEAVAELSLFRKELQMYQKYLPAFEKLYQDAGHDIQIAPKCLLVKEEKESTNFIFEDLKHKNFQNVDRLKGLNLDQLTRALQKLAEFHAASAVYVEKNGEFPDEFQFGFIQPEKSFELTKSIYENRVNAFKDSMSKWGIKEAEKYIKNFPTFEQYWKCAVNTTNVKQNPFNVLNHGDFWTSNLMLNFLPDGAVNELLLLDFQICKWGSPAEDLLFFISISAANDIRIKEFDHLIQIYHERLAECLKILKYQKPIPKLREIHMSLYQENVSFYAFFAVFNHMILVLLPTDKDSNMHSVLNNDEAARKFIEKALNNPLFVEAVKELYPFYYRRGIFNFKDYD